MKKRFLAMALTLCMVFVLFPVPAQASAWDPDDPLPVEGYYLSGRSQYSNSELFYTVNTSCKYDTAGRLVEKTTTSKTSSSSYTTTITYEYDSAGRCIKEKSSNFGEDYTYTYDNNGNFVKTNAQGRKIICELENGKVVKSTNISSTHTTIYEYIYNNSGKLLISRYVNYQNDEPDSKTGHGTVYTYDANGVMTRCSNINSWDGVNWEPGDENWICQCDANGNPTVIKRSDGTRECRYTYEKIPNYTASVTPAEPIVGSFKDVKQSAWYAKPVEWAVEKGITTGTTATTFSPNNTCTQAQILTFLYRAVGEPAVSGSNPYSNAKITSNQYYYNAMLWAAQKGIIMDGAIDPNAPCTRSDVVTYLWRLAGSPAASGAAFSDVPVTADYAQAVAWAVKEGVTTGTTTTTFSPNNTCTRAQIVTFLYRDLA